MPPRPHEELSSLIDAVAYAKMCFIVATGTVPRSPQRGKALEDLRQAVVRSRHAVDEIFRRSQAVSREILVQLRVCELGIQRLESEDTQAASKGGSVKDSEERMDPAIVKEA